MTMSAHDRDRRRPPPIDTLLPWVSRNVSVRPFGMGWWSFNPSVHRDRDGTWRCVYRCANYSLPDGVVQLSDDAHHGKARSRNVVAVLDPTTWDVVSLREVHELDDLPRVTGCSSLGLEDMRLFRTDRDGLTGIATALQYNVEHPNWPEMVLCRLSDECDVVEVTPIRGAWSCRPQKNWSPFDDATEPRLLYSIERGVVMSEHGPVHGSPLPMMPRAPMGERMMHVGKNGVEVKLLVNPNGPPPAQVVTTAPGNVGSSELRGGSQLIAIEDGLWLGIAHEMTTAQVNRRKLYWHTFYAVDGAGRMVARSGPLKLAQHDIEFAAGMAIDGDRVVISYGTDDHDARIGVTSLGRVLDMLRPVGKPGDSTSATATGATTADAANATCAAPGAATGASARRRTLTSSVPVAATPGATPTTESTSTEDTTRRMRRP
jgi:hypothetical protein